jgi:hypothetical protein
MHAKIELLFSLDNGVEFTSRTPSPILLTKWLEQSVYIKICKKVAKAVI